MHGILLALVIYFTIGICFYVAISMGKLNLDIQSKKTGEFLDKDTKEYEILKFAFSMGWIVMALEKIIYGGDKNGKDN